MLDDKDTKQVNNESVPVKTSDVPPLPTLDPVPKKPKVSKKFLFVSLGVVLAAALAAAAVMYFVKDKPGPTSVPTSSKAKSDAAPAKKQSHPVFCAGLGLRSIQCEDLETAEHRKYELPESFGDIVRMFPNKEGNKIFADVYKEAADVGSKRVETMKVYDLKFKELASLPVRASDSGSADFQDVGWLDDDSMVYSRIEGDKKVIYAFNIPTHKESVLMEADRSIERLMPSGDRRFVYAVQGLVNKTSNSVERKLVVINTDTKAIIDVVNDVIDVNRQELAYSTATSMFYADILRQADQKYDIRTFRMDSVATKPKLSQVGQLDDVRSITPYAYQVTVNKKGILAQPGTDYSAHAPLKFYTATDKSASLTLGVGARQEFYLSLQDFPELKKLASKEPETRDFFQPPAGIPQPIINFLDKKVTDKADCKPGEYRTFEFDKNDGEEQFGVYEFGCGASGLALYRREGASYKLVTSVREGMGCEQRDRLGISEQVFPECRALGEGY